MIPKKAIFVLLAVAVIGGTYLFGSRYIWGGPQIENIVFVTLDTLRADHLAGYGYPRNTAPFIESLEAKGIKFLNDRSAMSHTAPSHSSMFTSLYPFQHKLLMNSERLPKGPYHISDMAKKLGFEVVAFPAVKFMEGKVGFEIVKSDIKLPESISGRNWYRNATNVVDRVATWFKQRKSKGKLFIWVHMYDVHMWEGRENIPQEYLEIYSNEDTQHAQYLTKTMNTPLSFFGDNEKKMLNAINNYDGRIRYVDDQVKRLYSILEENGINKNSLWIITSDHGEGLGNHNYRGHGQFIYQEQLRVPLIMKFNPERNPGKVVNGLVRSVDIFPTIADLLDFRLPEEEAGMQGVSHAAVVSGNQADVTDGLLAFSQRRPKTIDHLRKDWEEGDIYAMQDMNAKYIHHTQGGDQFFDLSADSHEMNNLSGKDDQRESMLKDKMTQLMRSAKQYEASPKNKKMNAKEREELKALGYL